MKSDLENKVVLVTGGAGGIGSVISKSFAEQGAKVIVHYNNSKDNAEKIAKEIGGVAINADLTDAKQSEDLFDSIISKEGKIDVCLLYTSPSPRDRQKSRMPSSA